MTLAMAKGGDFALLFPLAVCLVKPETTHIFKYLWDKFIYVWDFKCLKEAFCLILKFQRKDLLTFILESPTTHSLFLSFSYHFRI